jgi:DnaJ-class molecular chaperone
MSKELDVVVLYVHVDDLDELHKGLHVVRNKPEGVSAGCDEHIELGRIHFDECPTCADAGNYQKEGGGCVVSGPCPTCKGSRKIDA